MKTIITNCQHGNFNASAEPGLAEYSKMIQQIEPGLNTEDADTTFWDSVSVVMCSELEWCSGVNSWYMKSFIRALTPIAVASLFKHLLYCQEMLRDATPTGHLYLQIVGPCSIPGRAGFPRFYISKIGGTMQCSCLPNCSSAKMASCSVTYL